MFCWDAHDLIFVLQFLFHMDFINLVILVCDIDALSFTHKFKGILVFQEPLTLLLYLERCHFDLLFRRGLLARYKETQIVKETFITDHSTSPNRLHSLKTFLQICGLNGPLRL